MLIFILIVWILSAMLSYSFFYLNILPGMNLYFLFLFVCILYSLYFLVLNKGALNWWKYGGKEFEIYFKLFVFWSSLFIIVSFFNLPKIFDLDNLLFDQSYIIRHASFLPSFAITFSIYLCAIKTDYVENVKRTYLLLLLFMILTISFIFGEDNIVYPQLIVMLSSLYFIKKKTYFALLILLYFAFIETTSMSSFIIASLLVTIILLYGRNIAIFLAKEYNLKTIMLMIISIIFIIIFNQLLLDLISSDANSLWRLNVWKNELRNLIQTYGMGVGYGAAYVDTNIFREVENSNMYAGVSDLFEVANHNTIINMFYRLGIVGGVVFVLMNITLVKWFATTYVIDTEYNKYLIWAFANYIYNFIIIILNPGLESPRFSFGYLISIGFLIGFIIKSRKLNSERELAT